MISDEFISLLSREGREARWHGDQIRFGDIAVPVVNGIPRFVQDEKTYSDGNFSKLRERHATLQLDSINGTTDRRDTLLERTGWDPSRFGGSLVLECGCGAGPDTEVLLALGARVVAVDLVGLDVARKNLPRSSNLLLMQADITDLPLKESSFDIVMCHRVLQHTPNPENTLRHILKFVKSDGDVFVHSYARTLTQVVNWKYALRPVTKRMPPDLLYRTISLAAPALAFISAVLCRTHIGRMLQSIFVPFRYYGHLDQFDAMSKEEIIEYGIHDTFDALSPRYDRPLAASKMSQIAGLCLDMQFEVVERTRITLLRTL